MILCAHLAISPCEDGVCIRARGRCATLRYVRALSVAIEREAIYVRAGQGFRLFVKFRCCLNELGVERRWSKALQVQKRGEQSCQRTPKKDSLFRRVSLRKRTLYASLIFASAAGQCASAAMARS